MEFAVVVVGDLNVGAKSEDANGVGDEVDVATGGQPEFVIDELLIEDEIAAFPDGEEAEAGVDIAVEMGDEAANFAILLVDPDGAGGVAGGFFGDAVGFRVGIAGEIEGDGAAAVEHDAARAGEIRHGKNAADADDDFAVGSLPGRSLLGFFDIFGDAVLLFLLLIGVEVSAIFFNQAPNLVGVDVEDFVLVGFGLFDAAVFIELVDHIGFVEGVVFLDGVHLALVIADLVEEGRDVGDRRGRGLRRCKDRNAEKHGKNGCAEEAVQWRNSRKRAREAHVSV